MSKFAIAAVLIITFCTTNVLTAAQPASAQSDVATAGSKSAIVARPASGELSSSKIRDPAVDLKPVAAIAQRVVPWLSKDLVLEAIPRANGKDVFELRTQRGKLILGASDAPSAAAGLNYYLRYFCHRSISHMGSNLAPVKPLPMLRLPVRRVSPFKYRYLLNYCTLNYTLSFARKSQAAIA